MKVIKTLNSIEEVMNKYIININNCNIVCKKSDIFIIWENMFQKFRNNQGSIITMYYSTYTYKIHTC